MFKKFYLGQHIQELVYEYSLIGQNLIFSIKKIRGGLVVSTLIKRLIVKLN